MNNAMWVCFLFFSAIVGIANAADSTGFQVYVYGGANSECKAPESVPNEAELLFDGTEISTLVWSEQAFVINQEATKRLVIDISRLETEEDFVPGGKFPDAEGKAFVIVLNGAIVTSGRVSGMVMLQKPPDCVLLYPAFPMVRGASLAVAVGKPKSEEVREDFFKVLIEDGPAACFEPVLDTAVREYFAKQGKLK